jgi:predicted dehydrogenase
MNRIRLAVIGAGHLGRIHARLARSLPEVELVAVVDPVESSRDSVASENQTCSVASHTELAGQVDAAVIATPTRFHHAVAADLLSQGVHCLVEKPITLCASDADELIELAEQASSVLQVGHVERFNPAFLAGRHIIEEPVLIEAVRAAPYTFRSTDVSVVLDLMIHDIDLALSLVRSEVRRVDAIGGKVVGPNEDWAQARITFASGAVASLSASRVQPTVQRTMNVIGPESQLWLDFQAKTAKASRPGNLVGRPESSSREAVQAALMVRELPIAENNAILEELREFAAAIQFGSAVTATGQAGRDAVAVAEQVLCSIAADHELSRRPAILPFMPVQGKLRKAG